MPLTEVVPAPEMPPPAVAITVWSETAGVAQATVDPHPATPITVALRAGDTLSGTVLDAKGKPVPRTRVAIDRPPPDGAATSFTAQVDTDAAGRFQLHNLLPGTYNVMAEVDGHAPPRVTCKLPDQADVTLRMTGDR